MSSIMVVEDDPAIAENLVATLEDLGYEVPAVASQGEQALRQAKEVRPDLILMDIRLNGVMDGIEAAARLRAELPTPVVYLTAFADDRTIERARLTQPGGYLMKPFSQLELKSAIEIALFRRVSEKATHDRARLLEATLQSLGEAVISTDLHGSVIHMNPAAEDLTEWRSLDAVGLPIGRVCPIEREADEAAAAGDEDGPARRPAHGTLVTRSGRRVPVEDSSWPIDDQDHDVLGLVLVLRDISDESASSARAALSDRLATIGSMAEGIETEVGGPLAEVLDQLSLALGDLALLPASDEGVPAAMRSTHDAADPLEPLRGRLVSATAAALRIRRALSELSNLRDPIRINETRIDLGALLALVALTAGPAIDQRARLRTEVDGTLAIRGRRTRLIQALTNLVVGAGATIPPGTSEHHEVLVSARAEGAAVVIEVRDTAVALSGHEHRHRFDPFTSRRAPPIGSGLGMWLAHRILTEQGAHVWSASHGDRGNRIVVELPLADGGGAR